jgi:alanine-glyoxylate transaminase/serine-glyoxylate transaminase/serine-pyruvate transaminase
LLWKGLTALGLEPFVPNPSDRLVCVNTIKVPEGIDWAAVCKLAMDKYSVEIAGGLGPSAGKVWRVGVMGFNARPNAIEQVLVALKDALALQGWKGAPAAEAKTEL